MGKGEYNFFDPHLRDDPYPFFDRLREDDPVYQTDFGYWYVSRYDDIVALVRDPRLGAGTGVADSLGLAHGRLRDLMDTWVMSVDGAHHTRVRRLFSRAFTPRAVEALRPAIEAVTAAALDRMAAAFSAGEPVDVVGDLAFAVPMEVVRLLFGAPADEWDERVVALFDGRDTGDMGDTGEGGGGAGGGPLGAMVALSEYFEHSVLPARRDAPGDDIFSAMVVGDDEGTLGDFELIANAVLLVTAGFETTQCLLANTILALLSHPDALGWLLADPRGRAGGTIEECLRWEPAALSTTRQTTCPVEVAGTTIPEGAKILFSVIAGNRDPRRYSEPSEFDPSRIDIRPLTFGGGVHVCVGAALARLEGEIVIGALFERFPGLELAPEATVEWAASNPTVRRPSRLLVRSGR